MHFFIFYIILFLSNVYYFANIEQHKELVDYASSFDSFTDMFKGKNIVNSQADVIREYIYNKKQLIKDIMVILPYIKEGA